MDNSIFAVGKRAVIFSYITQLLLYCSSIIIIPFILSNIDGETLGVWYLFVAVSGITLLVDFGFSSSLSRNISFAFSGAKELVKEGSPDITENREIDFKLVSSLLYTSKRTYLIISLIILTLLCTVGTAYVHYVVQISVVPNLIFLWLFYSLSISINYYYNYVSIFIRGRGLISLYNKVIIISKVSYIVITLVLFYFGWDIWALVVSTFASALIGRYYGLRHFYDDEFKSKIERYKNERKTNYFPIIWYNAKKFGIASFTTYAFSQANVLIAGLFLSLGQTAQLGLVLQVCSIIVTLSRVYFNTYYPKICSLWVTDDVPQIKKIFLRSQLVGYAIWFLGFGFLLVLGNWALTLIHSQTLLPSNWVIVLYAFFYLMELTHGNCSMIISSRNSVPFLKAAVMACVVSLLLMFVLSYMKWGIYAFPIAMICANLPYNSWKWVVEAYKLLKNA